jgi:Flp pilus assembly protein TadG
MIQSKTPKHGVRRKGGSVLEAALIVPILVTLGFGMAEFSYFFFVKHTLEGAAREAARNGIVPSTSASSVAYAAAVAAGNNAISAAGLSTLLTSIGFQDVTTGVTLTSANFTTATSPGDAIKATVTATWGSIGVQPLPTAMGGIPATKLVVGTCVMRKEG